MSADSIDEETLSAKIAEFAMMTPVHKVGDAGAIVVQFNIL